MGASFAPSYANLYLGWWERSSVYGSYNPFREHIIWYGQYIDDLLFIWDESHETIRAFHTYLNDKFNLNFTLEHNQQKIHFWDLRLTGNRHTG